MKTLKQKKYIKTYCLICLIALMIFSTIFTILFVNAEHFSEQKDIPSETIEPDMNILAESPDVPQVQFPTVEEITYDIPLESMEEETEEIVAEETETVYISEELAETTESAPDSSTYEISENEICLLATLAMAEAEAEPIEGRRLVIDSVLNRIDNPAFSGDTVKDIIYAPNQYSCINDGRFARCYVQEENYNLVLEELECRYNTEVVFFRTLYYSPYGTPMFQLGNHYFSKY